MLDILARFKLNPSSRKVVLQSDPASNRGVVKLKARS